MATASMFPLAPLALNQASKIENLADKHAGPVIDTHCKEGWFFFAKIEHFTAKTINV